MSNTQNTLTVVVGLGKTGLSCIRYLTKQGVPVAVVDTRANPPGLAELQAEFPQIQQSFGKLDADLLMQASEIVISPGLSVHEPAIAACIERGISVIGDIELFARRARAPICAITGSNAKSTVTTLVAEMASCAGLVVRMGGNIGTPALELLKATEPDLYVLELSSFQLETTESLKPTAATILNISPDHMDRYQNLDEYIAAKQKIHQHADFIVVNRDDSMTLPVVQPQIAQISFGMNTPKFHEFGIAETPSGYYLAYGDEPLLSVEELTIKGAHNWANALAALALGYAMKLPMPAMLRALQAFPGLPHRCQWVAKLRGVNWYNDSKGTNIGATIAAIEGLASDLSGKIVLIAGGLGKDADFSALRVPVQKHVRAVVLIGKDAPILAEALADTSGANNVAITFAANMEEAVNSANSYAQSGDAVLLSPACASFDMFRDFEHRGEVFMQTVKELKV